MSAHFAMLVQGPSTVPAARDGAGELLVPGTGAGVAGRVAAGPGLWEDWLADLRREGLIEELLADGVIAGAVAGAEHGHRLDRALTAEVTALCVITGALFPDQGYDMILATVFGMPGVPVKPGTVTPTGPALSKARERLGEQVMRKVFELDAARADIAPGPGGTAFGLELTVFDGTTAEVFNDPGLAAEFGVPEGGTKPKIRIAAHVRTGSRRWIAAAIAVAAEDAGFDSFWVMDHYHQIANIGPPSDPMLEAYTVLSGVAARTSRISLGALVTGFLLIPTLGSQQSYRSLTILLAVCGLATLVGERRGGGSKKVLAFLSMALVVVVLALPSWNLLSLTSGLSIYFRPLWVTPESRLLFFGDLTERARQHVGGLGERADEQRLAQARHADEQQVAARQQRDQGFVDHPVLPEDDPADRLPRGGDRGPPRRTAHPHPESDRRQTGLVRKLWWVYHYHD